MRQILIIGIGILLLTTNLKGQTVSDVFRLIPAEYVHDLSLSNRNKILKNEKFYPADNDKENIDFYALDTLNTLKNFLRVEMSDEIPGHREFASFEIRSFTKKNGEKLFVFSNVGGLPCVYQQNDLQFFEYKKGKLEISKTKYLPMTIDSNEFLKPNTPDSLKKEYANSFCASYELIDFGDNIIYRICLPCGFMDDFEAKYLLGNAIEFKWNGESFERTPGFKRIN